MRTILHIDFNSYFATIEQQANPRLRGKPIGVTGGDRLERTVLGAVSVEAKRFGVKTGMHYYEASKLCPQIILVRGDSDKYLECTKRFLLILKNYSSDIEIFSIDEVFLEFKSEIRNPNIETNSKDQILKVSGFELRASNFAVDVAMEIKDRIRKEVGEWVSCSIGISYNKLMAKLASDLYKPDGLVVIEDEAAAEFILDRVPLDQICGIGSRIKKRLNNMGVFSFADLRKIPLGNLKASFKEHTGNLLFNMARGVDNLPIIPFYQQAVSELRSSAYEKEEVKSIGHRHTLGFDTDDPLVIKQVLLKLSELVARRLRKKRLIGKTVSCYFRNSQKFEGYFIGDGMQVTINATDDGLEIFKAGWKAFQQIWGRGEIRMIGVSISNLQPARPQMVSFLEDLKKREVITRALDNINNKYGEFTLQRGVLLGSKKIQRMANSFMSDRRFKLGR